MGFLDFIEKLQKKPELFRRKIALLAVLIVMLAIIAVWLTTLDFSLNEEEIKKAKQAISPFAVFIDNFKEFGSSIKSGFSQ